MNEQRIREIANQASDHAENTVEYFPDTEDGLDYPAKMMKVRDLKFAQLIVQECITIVDEQKECLHEEQRYWHDRDYGYEMAVNDAGKGIKQHFGVEE